MPDSRRFEAGSLNTTGIFGLRAALELQEEIGREVIAAEVVRIATDLSERLESAGLEVRSPRPIGSGIVAVAPRSVEASTIIDLHRFLEASGVICSPREGTLRFSPHFYNTEEENQRVADLLASRLR
jgi:selenocysteine lyase/cysteine desulfurase